MIPPEKHLHPFHFMPMSELPQQTLKRIRETFFDSEKPQEQRIFDASKEIEWFFQRLNKSVARKETFELILWICNLFITTASLDASKLVQTICIKFVEYFLNKKCGNENEINEIIFAKIPMELWAECVRRVIYLDITDCVDGIDKLFHVKTPRTNLQSEIIQKALSRAMEKPWDFQNAVLWINIFNIEELKNLKFEETIYRSYIYHKPELIESFLKTDEDKLRYLKTLDKCYARGKVHGNKNELEIKFFEVVGYDTVPDIINEKAKEYGIIVNTADFCFYRIRDMKK